MQIKEIPLEQILPNPEQPRKDFNIHELKDLANSIKENGLEHAITVEQLSDEKFQLIDGERRLRACALVGIKRIRAEIQPYRGEDPAAQMSRLVSAVVSNEQAAKLSPIESGKAYKRMQDLAEKAGEKLKAAGVGRKIGRSTAHVLHALSLLDLQADIQDKIHNGEFTNDPRVISSILKLPKDLQVNFVRRMIAEKASIKAMVFAAERVATNIGHQPKRGRATKTEHDQEAFAKTPTPALFLALDEISNGAMPSSGGTLEEDDVKALTLKLCSECPSLPSGVTTPPSWLLLQRAAKKTCAACELGAPENRSLNVCEQCPAVQLLKISMEKLSNAAS